MVSGPDDDFSTFLEFGDLQLNFPFDANPQNGSDIQDGVGPAIDMQANDDSGAVLDFHHGDLQQFGDPSSLPGFSDNPYTFQDLSMPPHLFEQQQLLHQYPQHPLYGPPYNGHHVIPPTPNSMEMHGGHAQYQHTLPTNHARTMYEQHRRQTKAQVSHYPSHAGRADRCIGCLHPLGISCRHPARCSVPISRLLSLRRALQPPNVAGIGGPER